MEEDMQIVAAPSFKNVEAQYVEMMVPLYSYGCEKKVKKTLSHLKGIYSINVDYTQQKVTVWGICNKYDVLQMMRNKRKEARFWNNPEDNVVLPDQNDEKLTLALSKDHKQSLVARSRSWKAWKKLVFTRSKSF